MSTPYVKLENRLVLLAWLNSLLGYESNRALLTDTKNTEEGFIAAGRGFIYHHIIGRGRKVKIDDEDLKRYDENIHNHLKNINRGRTKPITLRYFQYLAIFYTEIFLDRYFNHRGQMLAELNLFVRGRNIAKLPGEPSDKEFTEEDLSKIAFWMATGSGKTLIFHFNYYQYLHYASDEPDNILLITPNEGLTEQHLKEMAISGISAQRFDLNLSGLFSVRNAVQVIEITKLVEDKYGGGISVPVEAFEGRNLIFVDEGHKGSGGKAWRSYRDALGKTGFTFEYSATFGQALSAARRDLLTTEYGKAIIFDYSYRYFHGDGYGKDFRILNLCEGNGEEDIEMLLLGNLLSFYEQLRIYEDSDGKLQPYNIEKPLWIFVGSTVNAVYTRKGKRRSDVLTVVRFLHHVLKNKNNWVIKGIEKLLQRKSGLKTPDGTDMFAKRFEFLQEIRLSAEFLYADIMERIFHSTSGGALHLCDIRNNRGELGLKAGNADCYFGLIYIGDILPFKRLIEKEQPGIILEEDVISKSLFGGINQHNSRINILIGAKKFIEGWNSWRVSNMGLLNVGRRAGSQIIQLFGRGVRLRGKDYSLKRSTELRGNHPVRLPLLETLDIFAVRADYMAEFRNYLEREGVETEGTVELSIPISTNKEFLQRGLVVPRIEDRRNFEQETVFMLEPDPSINVTVDMSVKIQAIESSSLGLQTTDVHSGTTQKIPPESITLVDWEQIYLDILAYKERKEFRNLIIHPEILQKIIVQGNYTLIANENIVKPCTFADYVLFQEAIIRILRKYLDSFYRNRREQWETENMVYCILDPDNSNLVFNRELIKDCTKGTYIVKVRKSAQELIKIIEQLGKDIDSLYRQGTEKLPHLYFDRHIYLPLLLKKSDKFESIPPGLTESEEQFVLDLKDYWEKERDKSLCGKEIFLLRNLSRGRGVGFFKNSGFYPDFIMWVKNEIRQRVIFIEPHGMIYAKAYIHDEKAQLHERLPGLAKGIEKRSKRGYISLDSFIISATPYDDLYRRYGDGTWDKAKFAHGHILFPERDDKYDYIKIILV